MSMLTQSLLSPQERCSVSSLATESTGLKNTWEWSLGGKVSFRSMERKALMRELLFSFPSEWLFHLFKDISVLHYIPWRFSKKYLGGSFTGEWQILIRRLKKIHSSARDHILIRFPDLRKASKWPTAIQVITKGGDDSHTEGYGEDDPKLWKL